MQHRMERAVSAPALTDFPDSLRNPPGTVWPAIGNAALQEKHCSGSQYQPSRLAAIRTKRQSINANHYNLTDITYTFTWTYLD